MMRNLFILICLSISFISCLYPSCDDIVGTYYNIDEGESITHYIALKEDGTYIQYYKNDTIEKRHKSTWQWAEQHCTIELWNWHVYKTSSLSDVFDEQLGVRRANELFVVNGEDLRLSYDYTPDFYKEDQIEEVKRSREAKKAYWEAKDTLYYENGAVKEIGKLDGGDKYGNWQVFYETGELKSEGVMVNNHPAFLWKYYYKNRNLKKLGAYENSGGSPKIGPWEYYHENGQLKEKGIYIYIKGKPIRSDEWEIYDTFGELIKTKKYRSREKYYDSVFHSFNNEKTKEYIELQRSRLIESEDQFYLEYKSSLKDTVN
ncbi:MAG: antitoxin component YwqK of YwqJK toxin-antitoxin module [Dokdonia sp.]|jgi:antitoxin component YwqK of YwqJK toxin-antitoxin module